jgi:hypothetical protein
MKSQWLDHKSLYTPENLGKFKWLGGVVLEQNKETTPYALFSDEILEKYIRPVLWNGGSNPDRLPQFDLDKMLPNIAQLNNLSLAIIYINKNMKLHCNMQDLQFCMWKLSYASEAT